MGIYNYCFIVNCQQSISGKALTSIFFLIIVQINAFMKESDDNFLSQFLNFKNNSLCRYHDIMNYVFSREEYLIDLSNMSW